MRYERHYVWSILLRLFHWCFALSIVTLVVTGFYIHFPWTNTLLEGSGSFPVATMRYIHFVAGFVFTGSILARFYLLVFGNRQERVWDFLPVTPTRIAFLHHGLLQVLHRTHSEGSATIRWQGSSMWSPSSWPCCSWSPAFICSTRKGQPGRGGVWPCSGPISRRGLFII